MSLRRTMTVSWDGLDDDDGDDSEFFESSNRMSTIVPLDLAVPSYKFNLDDDYDDDDDDDVEFVDPRVSFSAMSFARPSHMAALDRDLERMASTVAPPQSTERYDIWMASPGSITERRRRLLNGMGLNSRKDFSRITTLRFVSNSKKFDDPAHPRPSVPLPVPAAAALPPASAARIASKRIAPAPAPAPLPTSASVPTGSTAMADEKLIGPADSHGAPSALASHPTSPHSRSQSVDSSSSSPPSLPPSAPSSPPPPSTEIVLFRSRSDGDMESHAYDTKRRREELIGCGVSKQKLTRTSSTLAPCARLCRLAVNSMRVPRQRRNSSDVLLINDPEHHDRRSHQNKARGLSSSVSIARSNFGTFFLIKNLDTGKEFIVKEFDEDGMWNRLSDLQTGKQLTMEEFEKSVGYSPVVKELMRRENYKAPNMKAGMKIIAKSFKYSKKKSASLLKNLKSKANSMTSGLNIDAAAAHTNANAAAAAAESTTSITTKDIQGGDAGKEQTDTSTAPYSTKKGLTSEWVKVKQQGKTYKDLTAMSLCQEIASAHKGSIWAMKFNPDGRYLATAGEDKAINVWEVEDCDVASQDGTTAASASSEASSSASSSEPLDKKKGKSASKKMPDYVQLPETVFSLSDMPVCSFTGHQDDVLDLSWSAKQLWLLSSSMDKTVRLWDVKTKTCVKMFGHNDYVTCIQFNPTNDDYFLSGSLDGKIRIWNVSHRRVVDWADLHEMVTAACYSPDGQSAAIGSHKGNCRMYSTADKKLSHLSTFQIPTKKKVTAKVTGLQILPEHPSEVLVTAADSRIRVYEGEEITQKFRGFKNTNSQIAASYSPNGKHIICASEDSNVYIWKREETKANNNAKAPKIAADIGAFEQFPCKDVSVAITWPGYAPSKEPGSPTQIDANSDAKKELPPLPKKKNHKKDKTTSNVQEKNQDDSGEKEKAQGSSDGDGNGQNAEKAQPNPEPEGAAASSESSSSTSTGESSATSAGDGASASSSSTHAATPSWSAGWFGGGGTGGGDMQPTAWGLVIVTAGSGGEIRAYQNFGLPVKNGQKVFS